MKEQVREILDELLPHLRAIYGARLKRTVLFGSQARGDAEPESDIDVLVVLEGPVNPCHEIDRCVGITADLSLKHTVVISTAYVSEDRYISERSPFLMNVRREGVTL